MHRPISVEFIGTDGLTVSERALWLGWTQDDPAYQSPFFHPDFTAVAGQIAPGSRLAVLHRAGEIVGFFPHQRRGRAAQPLAAPINDYHGVIAGPGQAPAIDQMAALLGARSLTVTGWTGQARPSQALSQARTLIACLPEGWEAYTKARRSEFGKFFKDKDRSRRALERDLGPVRVDVRTAGPGHFERLIELKQDQYRRSRRHDIFACGWTVDLLRALMAHPDPAFGVRLAVLFADERPMAYELGLQGGDHYHFWIPAYEAEAARYSPGMLLSMDTMQACAAGGIRRFDFGFEGEAYKKYFCNEAREVWEGASLPAGLMQAVNAAATLAGAHSAMEAGAGLVSASLAQSVRRRWAVIDACETTALGRIRAVTAAASAMLGRTRSIPVAGPAPSAVPST
ncbi:MAG: GNAT family N-acetyltransferase [Caulobacter sp.]|nr:GNAT family N-acetyltransferase [Caulobacter sp.]